MSHRIPLQPPAKQLINGIRSMGYTFYTAISDIIDNSITANSTEIDILFDPTVSRPYLCIVDNGTGMSFSELENAMTFGSNRDNKVESINDLGRFGLGLKTASLSQCKDLVVVSKKENKLSALSYNLDEINLHNEWSAKVYNLNEINELPEINNLDKYSSGTMVLWRDFDKLDSTTNNFEKTFRKTIDETIHHVSLVFHQFYEKINIRFNSINVPQRDPFLTNAHGRTQKGREVLVGRSEQKIVITPYTLPYLKSLNLEEKALLGDPKSIHDEQGFYIYRNNRLIIWGTWLKLGFRSELNKLARVKVEIPSLLDHEWSLDVKKSTAKIPDYIKEQIRIAIEDAVSRSKRVYKHKGFKEVNKIHPVWKRTFDNKTNTVIYNVNRETNTILNKLVDTMDDTQKTLLNKVLEQIESYLPRHQVQLDQLDELTFLNSPENINLDELEKDLLQVISHFPKETRLNLLETLLNEETYIPLSNNKKTIMEKITDDNF